MNRDEFVKRLFARAKEAGFEDCEVYCASGNEFSCSVFKGEIVSYSSAETRGLGFRGIIGGKNVMDAFYGIEELEESARVACAIEKEGLYEKIY